MTAVLSGAVSLHWPAIFYASAAALVFLFWSAAADRELGRCIAESPVMSRPAIIALAVGCYFLLMIVPFVLLDLFQRVMRRPDAHYFHVTFLLVQSFRAALGIVSSG